MYLEVSALSSSGSQHPQRKLEGRQSHRLQHCHPSVSGIAPSRMCLIPKSVIYRYRHTSLTHQELAFPSVNSCPHSLMTKMMLDSKEHAAFCRGLVKVAWRSVLVEALLQITAWAMFGPLLCPVKTPSQSTLETSSCAGELFLPCLIKVHIAC